MNKLFLIFIFALLPLTSFGQNKCQLPSQIKRVVLFIDANNGPDEIKTAREAACLRGEQLLVVPSKKEEFLTPALVKEELKKLAEQKKEMTSMIISGHDGGGNFSGSRGSISRKDLSEIMDPTLKASLKSVYLLGCYTGVKAEMYSWAKGFPNLNIIAGYSASAPFSNVKSGHNYLRDMMLKEKKVGEIADGRKLEAFLTSQIASLTDLNASVGVVDVTCEADSSEQNVNGFMFDMKRPKGSRSTPLNGSNDECYKVQETAENYLDEYEKYSYGVLPIPENTSSGPLRKIYSFFREYEHCSSAWRESNFIAPETESILGLLFFDGYKTNIAKYLNKELSSLYDKTETLVREEGVTPITISPELAKGIDQFKHLIPDPKQKEFTDCVSSFPRLSLSICFSTLSLVIPDLNLNTDQMSLYTSASEMAYNEQGEYLRRLDEDLEFRRRYNLLKINDFRKKLSPSEIKSLTRKEVMDLSNGLQELIYSNKKDPFTEDELKQLETSFDPLMNDLECLPLNWHEAQSGELSPATPTCDL